MSSHVNLTRPQEIALRELIEGPEGLRWLRRQRTGLLDRVSAVGEALVARYEEIEAMAAELGVTLSADDLSQPLRVREGRLEIGEGADER